MCRFFSYLCSTTTAATTTRTEKLEEATQIDACVCSFQLNRRGCDISLEAIERSRRRRRRRRRRFLAKPLGNIERTHRLRLNLASQIARSSDCPSSASQPVRLVRFACCGTKSRRSMLRMERSLLCALGQDRDAAACCSLARQAWGATGQASSRLVLLLSNLTLGADENAI